jgi:MFS family permease
VVLLPLFVVIERRQRAPMLDLTLFEHPLFATASAAAFLNGLSRFALTFLFVFYFQGPQGDDAITAGVKLTPLALGMLLASPAAGWWADRRGSRGIAVAGMLVQAVGLAGMTMLEVDTNFWWTGTWLAIAGIGSGMFNSPNTAAMMGVVVPVRRGIAAGARVMLQNTGAVLSIAALIAIITTGVPKDVMFSIFSGLTSGLDPAQLEPFIHNMHVALWALAGVSVVGAWVSWMRPRHEGAAVAGHVDHPVDEAVGELAGAPGFGGDAAETK